jgi:hypothetical protein
MIEPGKCSFYNPTLRKYLETRHVIRALHDFQRPMLVSVNPINKFSRIAAVSPD